MSEPAIKDDATGEVVALLRQGWLLSPGRPLVERFGREFFRGLPKTPGVYVMHGAAGRPRRQRILYVGKAKSLRQRLGSYRHIQPGRDSRKTVRLIHAVEEITWEICADETAALLRENELLREHRPLFNRVNIRPEAYGYIGLQREGDMVHFRLGDGTDERWRWFGAFKGGRRFALAAMLRLLVQANQRIAGWSQLPGQLLGDRAPADFSIQHAGADEMIGRLETYFTGRSWELVEWLAAQPGPATPDADQFLKGWREADLELIRAFYLNGPSRNRRWCEQLGYSDEEVLRPEDLDDLPIRLRLPPEPSPWATLESKSDETSSLAPVGSSPPG